MRIDYLKIKKLCQFFTAPPYILLLAGITAVTSCRLSPSPLDRALALSGENRPELEKVLTHYSQKETDTLPLQAARFLIGNMPGHYEQCSPSLSARQHQADSLHPDMPYIARSTIRSILSKKGSDFVQNQQKEDIKNITADFLIGHIDAAISMWQACPWLKDFSFDDFCEYILPYRIADEPLLQADSTAHLWKEVNREIDFYRYVPSSMDDIRSFLESQTNYKYDKYFHDLLTPQLPENTYEFDCLDKCYYDLVRFRHAGIPSVIDFIPDWATRNGRHYWRTIIEPRNLNDNFSETLNPRTAKVYRITYSHNPIPHPNGKDSIPELFTTPFYRDVTELYMKVTDLTLPVDKKRLGYTPAHIYLSIFNDLEWKPVAWAENKRGKVTFRHIGRDLIYLPIYFQRTEMQHIGYPIQIDLKGEATALRPDMQNRITLTLTRKYPLTYTKINWSKSLDGCCIEASNQADFSVSDTLAVLSRPSSSLNWISIPIQSARPYRYWRVSKKGRFIELGELEFYGLNGEKIEGEVITFSDKLTPQNAFDGNILTYCQSHRWIGLDCGKRTAVKEVRYTSRTDGNGIYPGHHYELDYFGANGWQAIAYKEATVDSLTFESVPANSLYWLKDLTEGKEERIFTLENGRVRFW